MTRKQLYIEERQDQALKQRAKTLGVSEADLVRRAIDHFFLSGSMHAREGFCEPLESVTARKQALSEFLVRARGVTQGKHALTYKALHRDELYDERENRWVKDDNEDKTEK